MNKQKYERITLVTILVNGKPIKVNPNSIRREDRQVLHGEFKGQQVNSPAIYPIGESIIFWPNADKPFAVAMTKADLGVLSTEFLKSEGFAVKAA